MRNSGVRVRIGVLATIVALAVFLPASARTARAQSAAGTVSSASGQVQIQRGGATLAATPGTPVNQGDKIVSGADGHAVIVLTDGSQLELSAFDHDHARPVHQRRRHADAGGPGFRHVEIGCAGDRRRSGQLSSAYAQRDRGSTWHGFLHLLHPSSPQLGNLPGISHYTEVAVIDGIVELAQATAPDRGVDVGHGFTATVPGDEPPVCHKRKFPTPRPTPTCSTLPVSVDQRKRAAAAIHRLQEPRPGVSFARPKMTARKPQVIEPTGGDPGESTDDQHLVAEE